MYLYPIWENKTNRAGSCCFGAETESATAEALLAAQSGPHQKIFFSSLSSFVIGPRKTEPGHKPSLTTTDRIGIVVVV